MSEKLTGRVQFRAEPEMEQRLNEIAAKHRRKAGEVARMLLERGLALYMRDALLVDDGFVDVALPGTVPVLYMDADARIEEERKKGKR